MAFATDFARRLLHRIDEVVLSIDAGIVAGGLSDHAAYCRATGKRLGLEQARAIVVEMLGENGREELRLGS